MAKKVIDQNQFSADLLTTLRKQIRETLAVTPKPWFAAFDADGTLWETDMGEHFFSYQIPRLKNLPTDPWKHYTDLKKRDHPTAYLWLAQISKGLAFEEVQKMAALAFSELSPDCAFESQKMWIQELQNLGVEIVVVTASVQWAVVPAAATLFQIPSKNILGVQTEIDSKGLVTSVQKGPMTWREGKALAFLEFSKGIRPVFSSGNTTGDTQLLELSSGPKLAVRSRSSTGNLLATELELFQYAAEKKWLTHQF